MGKLRFFRERNLVCSEIFQSGRNYIFGRNGSVVGGAVYVVKQLSAQNIGNRAGILTRINVGVSEKMRREQR